MNILQILDNLPIKESLYYVSIGCAESPISSDHPAYVNQQYPDFLEGFHGHKTVLLIDVNLQNPTYLESRLENIIQRIDLENSTFIESKDLSLFIFRTNTLIDTSELYETTVYFYRRIVSQIVEYGGCLVTHSFAGHDLRILEDYFEDILPKDRLLWSIDGNVGYGCIVPRNYLTDIELIPDDYRFWIPDQIPVEDFYQKWLSETDSRKMKMSAMIYYNLKKRLRPLGTFIDHIKSSDEIHWEYCPLRSSKIRKILSIDSRQEKLTALRTIFLEDFRMLSMYLPSTIPIDLLDLYFIKGLYLSQCAMFVYDRLDEVYNLSTIKNIVHF